MRLRAVLGCFALAVTAGLIASAVLLVRAAIGWAAP